MQLQLQEQYRQWQGEYSEIIRQEQRDIAHREAITQFSQWKAKEEQLIRKDAIAKSRSVTIGKVTEHVVPYMPEFIYNPKDARFIGSSIDFLIFDGLDSGNVSQVIFIEIKTGKGTLSTRERQIRDAIQNGRVQWQELRINREQELLSTIQPFLDTEDYGKSNPQ